MAVTLRPTKANAFEQRDNRIFAFMRDTRKEIQLEPQPLFDQWMIRYVRMRETARRSIAA
jgi:hypothetical protein